MVKMEGGFCLGEEKQGQRKHHLSLSQRKGGAITGVVDVISFDPKEIVLETIDGMMSIKGEELHVKRLSVETGEVDLEGKVDSMIYSEHSSYAKKGESLIKRLFK